ncbi:MAG: hypothetical protein LBR19_01545 [Bifidobacteriaceae bacterium]|jgi:hypothetical protein|nr:hypothetical protein [Bifidobacteriaceae bacterium]
MPSGSRRAKRAAAGHPPLDVGRARGGAAVRVATPAGDFLVTPPRPAEKTYTCPGCAQPVTPGQSQVTVVQADSLFGEGGAMELRRHWHTACWRRLAT